MQIRVVVYNVHGFRDGVDHAARLIGHHEPDLLLLNETGSRRALRTLSERLGTECARDPRSPFRRRIKNAVLVRPPWRLIEHRLHRFTDVRNTLNPRGALVARVGRAGRRVWALSIHLGLHPLERLHAAEEVADVARGLDGPVLIGGDCNEPPDGRAISFLGDRFWDAWLLGGQAAGETFPSRDPSARIDYLFVSEHVRVEEALVPTSELARAASDHLPLVAELTLVDPADGPAHSG